MKMVQEVLIINLLQQSWERKSETSDGFMKKHSWETWCIGCTIRFLSLSAKWCWRAMWWNLPSSVVNISALELPCRNHDDSIATPLVVAGLLTATFTSSGLWNLSRRDGISVHGWGERCNDSCCEEHFGKLFSVVVPRTVQLVAKVCNCPRTILWGSVCNLKFAPSVDDNKSIIWTFWTNLITSVWV